MALESNLKVIKTFPTLYGVGINGKIKTWSVHVETNNEETVGVYIIEFGKLEGKQQVTRREYTEGKNIGKKNETTPLQQCINEITRK